MKSTHKISVIIPVYNCASCLEVLCKNILELPLNLEIVLVEDCSQDESWHVISNLVQNNLNIVGVKLSRNFGQHSAIQAGLVTGNGDYYCVMDCDGQDDPKHIMAMWSCLQDGYEIVHTIKIKRLHIFWKNWFASLYNFIITQLSDDKNLSNAKSSVGNYSMFTRRVSESYLKTTSFKSHFLFIVLFKF